MDIYIYRDGEQGGPYQSHEVFEFLRQGILFFDDLYWSAGNPSWEALSTVPGLKQAVDSLGEPAAFAAHWDVLGNLPKDKPVSINSGDRITHLAGGQNLVNGHQTWELAKEKKHELDAMLACCEAELKAMEKTGLVAAPYYFERAAILFRKAKMPDEEISICKRYIEAVEAYYRGRKRGDCADVRKGPRYEAIKKRLAKARAGKKSKR